MPARRRALGWDGLTSARRCETAQGDPWTWNAELRRAQAAAPSAIQRSVASVIRPRTRRTLASSGSHAGRPGRRRLCDPWAATSLASVAHWLAYIALESDEVIAISHAAAQSLPPERFGVVTEVLPDGADGAVQLSLDVEASSLDGAMALVDAEWGKLRVEATLARVAPSVDFVVGPVDEPAVLHQTLLARATALARTGQPTYAVVIAQTAFEIYTRGLLRDLSRALMPAGVADVVQPRDAALRGGAGAKLFEALVGKRVTEAGTLWADYDAHVKRRNGIVHEGAEVDEATGEASIQAIRDLIKWIEKAVNERRYYATP